MNYHKILKNHNNYKEYLAKIFEFADYKFWGKAKRKNIQKAYEEYLLQFPSGIYKFDAKQKIDEFIRIRKAEELEKKRQKEIEQEKEYWKNTKEINSINAYKNYLEKYPNSIYGFDAKQKIEEIFWENVKKENLSSSYNRYINNYPNGKYVKECEKKYKEEKLKEEKIEYFMNWGMEYIVSYGQHIDNIAYLKKIRNIVFFNSDLVSMHLNFSSANYILYFDIKLDNIKNIPKEIEAFNITSLGLMSLNITEIPEFIFNLTNLEGLDLNYNQIKEIPSSIINLKALRRLNLSGNQLKTLPDYISDLSKLELLNIQNNYITVIPDSMTKLKQLGMSFGSMWGGGLFCDTSKIANCPNDIVTNIAFLSDDDLFRLMR